MIVQPCSDYWQLYFSYETAFFLSNAGGDGKALAFTDRYDATIYAHDNALRRMQDFPANAARAGVSISLLETRGNWRLPLRLYCSL